MTTVVIDGLLHESAAARNLEFIEMPPRIPEEDIIASRGSCAGTQFRGFLSLGPGGNARANRQAKRVCSHCPVRRECRVVADYLHDNMPDGRWLAGIWAGEGPGEQQERRRKERRQ